MYKVRPPEIQHALVHDKTVFVSFHHLLQNDNTYSFCTLVVSPSSISFLIVLTNNLKYNRKLTFIAFCSGIGGGWIAHWCCWSQAIQKNCILSALVLEQVHKSWCFLFGPLFLCILQGDHLSWNYPGILSVLDFVLEYGNFGHLFWKCPGICSFSLIIYFWKFFAHPTLGGMLELQFPRI